MCATVGGGFGGKVDVIVEPIAALGAMLTNRPVKYVYSRPEEMQVSSPRAAERLYIKDGVMNDGRIVARQVTLYVDAGAYCRHSTYGTTKAAAHMPGPYSIPNVHVDAWCVYTNRTPSSAMRGFGVTIGDFALEIADGRRRPAPGDGPDGAPPHQRLPRRRHEGAPQEGRGRGAGRGDPGRGARDRARAAGAVPRDVLDAAGGLRMAWLKGAGVASVNYPTGMNLGGDPSQALIHATTTGSFVITLSSVDLGQGIKTVGAQIAAETLGVPYDSVMIDTADTDTGPHCMGTFASRGTHRIGNAIIMAAREAREVMLEVAATELEVDAGDLVTDGKGRIHVNGAPDRGIGVLDVALAAHFKHGRTISGRGMYMKPKSEVVPETGEMDPDSCQAHACTVAEVEVDDETGEVRVLKLTNAYEIGRAVNPALAHQQIVGGAWMGISHALYETTEPYYPDRKCGPTDFSQYLMPGPGDIAEMESVIIERPAASGPYGAKGIGEMTANSPIPAIANAIFDACGVRVTTLPITPEKVLRGLDALRGRGRVTSLQSERMRE